jgi:hypothetical protein
MVFPGKNNPEKKLNYYGRIPNCVIGPFVNKKI